MSISKRILDGYGLELLQKLDAYIHEATGEYDEILRKYIRAARDPKTSVVIETCRRAGLVLVFGWFHAGIEVHLRNDDDLRTLCIKLRTKLHEIAPTPEARRALLEDVDLTEYQIISWTNAKAVRPRFGDLVRLANGKLGCFVHYHCPKTGYNVEVF